MSIYYFKKLYYVTFRNVWFTCIPTYAFIFNSFHLPTKNDSVKCLTAFPEASLMLVSCLPRATSSPEVPLLHLHFSSIVIDCK